MDITIINMGLWERVAFISDHIDLKLGVNC